MSYRVHIPSGLPFPNPPVFLFERAPVVTLAQRVERLRLWLKPHCDAIFFIGFALIWTMLGIPLGMALMPLAFWARDNNKFDGYVALFFGLVSLATYGFLAFMIARGLISHHGGM